MSKIEQFTKERIIYFGTKGCAGHYASPIRGDLSSEEQKAIEHIDCDFDKISREYKLYFFDYKASPDLKLKGIGFPASPDDKRNGSKTIVFSTDEECTERHLIEVIKSNIFLYKQFSKLEKMYNVKILEE